MPADVKRPSPNATASNWKGQSGYAGKDKRPASAQSTAGTHQCARTPGYSRPASTARPPSAQNKTPPKVQGSLRGQGQGRTARRRSACRSARRNRRAGPTCRAGAKPRPEAGRAAGDDRGTQSRCRARPRPAARRQHGEPSASPANSRRRQQAARPCPARARPCREPRQSRQADAASQRGKQSMPQGARSKGGGGGGKKQAR